MVLSHKDINIFQTIVSDIISPLSFPDSFTATKRAIVCLQGLSPGLAFITALSLSLHPSLMSPPESHHSDQTITHRTGSSITAEARLAQAVCWRDSNDQDILRDPDVTNQLYNDTHPP